MFGKLLKSLNTSFPYWISLVLIAVIVFLANAEMTVVTRGTIETGNLEITRFIVPATASATDALTVFVGDSGLATVSIWSGSEAADGTWTVSGDTSAATFELKVNLGNTDPIVWQTIPTAQVSNASNCWYNYGTATVDCAGARMFKVDVGNNSATQVVEIGVMKTR